jgi:exopolysaccharide biosynthesis protein
MNGPRDQSRYPGALVALAILASGQVLVVAGCIHADAIRADAPWPISVEAIKLTTPDGPISGYLATVDLSDPRVDVLVTAPSPVPLADDAEAMLTPTDTWAESVGAVLATNANFFRRPSGARGPWTLGEPIDVMGLSVSSGTVVSPARVHNGRPDPSVVFSSDRTARIGYLAPSPGDDTEEAVAGIGGVASDKVPGTLLVENGVNTGATSRVEPSKRHPRTAVGIRDDGRTLILAVIDGRQPALSVGITLPELADVLISRGATTAINLDGGGSSAFIYAPPGADRITNSPSDGVFRPVANHLGFAVAETSPTRSVLTHSWGE